MKVSDIMTHPVITVAPEMTIGEAAELMIGHRISGLPVVNAAGGVVGIVTEGDLLRRAETGTERRRSRWLEFLIAPGRLASEYAHAHGRRVGEVMTDAVVSVGPDDLIPDLIDAMERRRIKRVPVIERGRLVGIVSRANLVRALVQNLPSPDERVRYLGRVDPRSHSSGSRETALGPARERRGACREWRCRTARRGYRRPGAPGAARPRRKCAGRQRGSRSSHLGRAALRICRPRGRTDRPRLGPLSRFVVSAVGAPAMHTRRPGVADDRP